jgi:nucleoside-diphosphate kinase
MATHRLMEKTLVLLKPDAVQRGIAGEIISRFERCGLKIVAMKMVYADKDLTGEHYADDEVWLKSVGEKTLASYEKKGIKLGRTPIEQGQLIRQQLMTFISSSPVIAIVLEGHNAVAHVRKLVGPTAPSDAAPGTIRGDYSFETYQMADTLERPLKNLIHASGAVDEATREIAVWFKPEEIHVWARIDETLFYDN